MAWHGGKTGLSRVCGRPPVKAGPALKNPRQGPAPQRGRSRGTKTAERGASGCHLNFLPYAAARGAPSAQVWPGQEEMTAEPEGQKARPAFPAGQGAGPRVDLPPRGGDVRQDRGGRLGTTQNGAHPISTIADPSRAIPPSVGYADISPTRGEIARTVSARGPSARVISGGKGRQGPAAHKRRCAAVIGSFFRHAR